MATQDINVNALSAVTGMPSSTDSIVMVERQMNVGKIIDYNLLADAIIAKWKSTSFSDLATAEKTIVGALNELDSDLSDAVDTINDEIETEVATLNTAISGINTHLGTLDTAVAKCEVLVVDCGTISSLPTTINNANIEDDMVCIQSTLGTSAAQVGDWTITTADGSLTINGTISSMTTTLVLYLMKSR